MKTVKSLLFVFITLRLAIQTRKTRPIVILRDIYIAKHFIKLFYDFYYKTLIFCKRWHSII